MKEMRTSLKKLSDLIEDYSNISVPYKSQKQQQEKQEAYRKRINDISNKFKEMVQDVNLRMQQYIDLVSRSQHGYDMDEDGGTPKNDRSDSGY